MRTRLLCLLAFALPALANQLPTVRADQSQHFEGALDFVVTNLEFLSDTELLVTGSLAGEETFLGRYEGEVQYHVDLTSGAFSGSLVKVADNGDLLNETLTGQFTATGSKGTFMITGGAGRFSDATGSGSFLGVWTDPEMTTAFLTYSGWIDFHVSDPQAEVRPFKVTGGGIATQGIPITPLTPGPHWAVGEATGLGQYYGEGAFELLQFTGPTTAEFDSAEPFVFVAANGDRLAFTYGHTDNGAAHPGHVELFPADGGTFVAVFVAEFNPIPELSTGRYARLIDGSFVMYATTEPFVLGATDPVAYTWQGDGWLEFRKGKR